MADPESTAVGPRLHSQKGRWTLSVPIDEEMLIASAQRVLQKRFKRMTEPLDHVYKVKDYLQVHFMPQEQEVFACLFLDRQHRLIAMETLFYGTIDSGPVFPREVAKAALKHNCAALMAVHNHPSGSMEPSRADIQITKRLRDALLLVDVTLLDHFIVGVDGISSLAELNKI